MSQEVTNKEMDYLYKLQKDETEHQNHRLSWILAAQSILFVGFCTVVSRCDCFEKIIVPLIVLIGVLLSVSGIFSIIISDTSVGTIYERWYDYHHLSKRDINKPIPHLISSAPPHFLKSKCNFLMFYKFAPNVLCSAWLTLSLFCIDTHSYALDIFESTFVTICVFLLILFLICLIVQVLCNHNLYKCRYEDYREKIEKEIEFCVNNGINDSRCPLGESRIKNNPRGCLPSDKICFKSSKWKIYHIMVDRFDGGWTSPPQNCNAFLGGNLRGIINKLPYILRQDCNAIMLTPIFVNEAYHGSEQNMCNKDSIFDGSADADLRVREPMCWKEK